MTLQNIFVVGAGTMGNGIAQTAAVSGFTVTMMDAFPEALERGKTTIAKSVTKLAEKGRITPEQRDAALGMMTVTTLDGVASADIIIEAATE
ncbi:MAG TPA: 3-hydroxyacyl-CoA dehydrogenase NAD-binding domain-containing protein, partial [Anaerolineales bacterium]|nr:3-hydroxyacyl-CoA dehydrogenase NAD-binding domain-containing protein [Anaerolineales bacterium]